MSTAESRTRTPDLSIRKPSVYHYTTTPHKRGYHDLASAGHIILTPTQPVGARTVLGCVSNPRPFGQGAKPLPTELSRPQPVSKAAPLEIQKEIAEQTINELPTPTIEIFIDGSALDGTDYCGGWVHIKTNDEEISLDIAAGRYGSSYRAESVAFHSALEWLVENNRVGRIHIFTDSRLLVQKFQSGPLSVKTNLEDDTWSLIKTIADKDNTSLLVQCIPGHCVIEGNERAECYFKTARPSTSRPPRLYGHSPDDLTHMMTSRAAGDQHRNLLSDDPIGGLWTDPGGGGGLVSEG
ncbi:reverse transcriptase (RNA-dependent DNA polymerase) [Elysia marginata]|uniref:Reverse transcriptase (RNA-dependent DNA polymerase) n=1 Tax=Elysia marginata TaxID=1093978 RepID=A0AAV4F707_9GAST|nr:reverse transcriptase (RNA-dependent DNA polymerase) [Elysia marginata]